ncbi:MAG: RNA-binding domain-containing protein [Candidatus Hadarchaeales archaeon]
MKLPVSSAFVSVHCHATEDEEKVLRALRAIVPVDVEVRRTRAEGHHGNPIIVMNAGIREKATLSEVWKKIVGCGEQILPRLDERVDEHRQLHLRFDKQAAFRGQLSLTRGSDAIHLRLKINAFPPRRENAIRFIKDALKRGGEDEG